MSGVFSGIVRQKWLVAAGVVFVALALGLLVAGLSGWLGPARYLLGGGQASSVIIAPKSPPEDDGLCDFGRDPEKLWADNPDGHPFERPFCDPTGLDVSASLLHAFDTPEHAGKYCDEVPGCWAYAQ